MADPAFEPLSVLDSYFGYDDPTLPSDFSRLLAGGPTTPDDANGDGDLFNDFGDLIQTGDVGKWPWPKLIRRHRHPRGSAGSEDRKHLPVHLHHAVQLTPNQLHPAALRVLPAGEHTHRVPNDRLGAPPQRDARFAELIHAHTGTLDVVQTDSRRTKRESDTHADARSPSHVAGSAGSIVRTHEVKTRRGTSWVLVSSERSRCSASSPSST